VTINNAYTNTQGDNARANAGASGSAYNGFGKAVGTARSGSYSNFGATDTFTDTNGYSLNGVAINNADASASSPHPPSHPPSHPPPPPPPPPPPQGSSSESRSSTIADSTGAKPVTINNAYTNTQGDNARANAGASGSAYNGFGKAVGTARSGSYSNFGATDTFTDTNGYSFNGVAINNADAFASSFRPYYGGYSGYSARCFAIGC